MREYRGFTITHEHDGYWRIYRGIYQVGWARRLRDCKRMINERINP